MSSYKNFSYFKLICVGVLLSFFVSACASSSASRKPSTTTSTKKTAASYSKTQGSYHTVKKGETLWRISKLYDVEVLKQFNSLVTTAINAGDQLFIPALAGVGAVVNSASKAAINTAMYPTTLTKKYFHHGFSWPVNGVVITHFGQIQDGVRAKGNTGMM